MTKRFGQVDYDEVYYIFDKQKLKTSYEELLDFYKGEEFAEEMAKDDYCQQALENSLDGDEVVELLNNFAEENKQLKKELKRCKDWINSDKNDYELTLAFIKNKGYSLKDVLEYEKELKE